MHKLLDRQISKYFGKDFDISSLPQETLKLLETVSSSYENLYQEKKFLEHTLDVNSKDLEQANKKIKEQNLSLQQEVVKTSGENEQVIHLLKQYKEAIDTSLIVSTTDISGKIKYVNKNFCKISGYSEEELVGSHHNIVRHPDNKKDFFEQLWKTILNKEVWQGVFPNLAKNGSTYYVSATIVPLLNVEGEIVEFMALREDITKTIKYQEELEAEKRRVSDILDNQESIIVLLNQKEGVIEVNKKFFEIFHFESLDEFRMKHSCVCELFEEKVGFLQRSNDNYHWIDPILESPEKVHLAMIDKKIYSVKLSIITINNDKTFLSTFTDITEIEEARIKSEEAEKTKSNFLANMSHEIRTPMNAIFGFSQLLAKTQLDSKQEKFVELIKNSTSMLISIINDILDFSKLESGNITTNLVSINPFMEFEETFMLLLHKAKDKNLSYLINIDPLIEECIVIDDFHIKQILMNLIGNAIKFTNEQGTIDIKIQKHSVDGKKILRFSVQDSGIGISQSRQQKIFEPFAQADGSITREFGGTGLGLSISNSLVNILGSKLCLESQEGVGSKFYFDIEYESCITKKTLKSHLEQFYVYLFMLSDQSHLAISKQLKAYEIKFETILAYDTAIDLKQSIVISTDENVYDMFSNANVLVLSKEDHGHQDPRCIKIEIFEEFPSVIYNELMRLKVIQTDADSLIKSKDYNLKILVAEDYDINRILISELLNQYEIVFEFAFNGQEAVDLVQKNNYDLILMDINMPVMDGFKASNIIINELNIKTPIVALTANALEGDMEKCLACGMDGYLSKPINMKAFEDLLAKYSKKRVVSNVTRELNIKESLEQAALNMRFSEKIIQKLFISFVESLEEMETNIVNGIGSKDFGMIEMNAHNLKSGAASLCFEAIVTLAQKIETNARNKSLEFDFITTFREIQSYLEILRKELN